MNVAVMGDLHGVFPPLYSLKPDTELCLDTGELGVFSRDEEERKQFQALEELPFEIAFVEGNHDNIDYLSTLPVSIWNGGNVHRVAKNIVHLIRGEIYCIGGKKLFAFGGGVSADRLYREKEGIYYWRSEMPAPDEYDRATKNLAKENNQVDYILTHTAPSSCAEKMCGGKLKDPAEAPLNVYLEKDIMNKVNYSAWFCGHFHQDVYFAEDRVHCLFKQPVYIDL